MIRPPASRERGATAITVAASLLLLMGFAAIAVDTGAAYSERRDQQNAVDAGLLSAAVTTQKLPVQTGCLGTGDFRTAAACNGAMVAIDNINSNLGTAFTETDFADTARCPNSAFPTEYEDDGSYSAGVDAVIPRTAAGNDLVCMRYTSNLDKLRIILPVTDVDTTFGQVIGRDQIAVSARGEVEITKRGPGSVIPFLIGPTGAGQNAECVFEPASELELSPCDGPDAGNFGYLQPYLYGDDTLGTPTICSSGAGIDPIAMSFAKGADHVYQLDSLVPGANVDQVECPNKAQEIDYVDVQTGGSVNALTEGLFGLPGGTEGRLRCKDGDAEEPTWFDVPLDSQGNCDDVNGNIITGGDPNDTWDSTPLWEFINSGANSEVVGGACVPGGNAIKDKFEMEACLDGWRDWSDGADDIEGNGDDIAHTKVLFTEDIVKSPRFAWVPVSSIDPQTGGSGLYSIIDFRPVYLQTLFLKCNANDCDIVHDPGEPSSGPCPVPSISSCGWPDSGNKGLSGMTAFIIRDDMLPPHVAEFPFSDAKIQFNLSE